MKKVLFMGTPDFSATILEGLMASEDYDVIAVVTQPDRQVGRKREKRATPVKRVALAHGLPVYQPEKLSQDPMLGELKTLEADVIVTAAFGQILPVSLLKAYPSAVNVHASLLPKYRGGAPIHYAIMNGDEETGITIMEMEKEMDAGAIIHQRSLPILDEDTAGTLFEKLAVLGRDLLLETLSPYLEGSISPIPQDATDVTFSPTIKAEEEKIDWSKDSRDAWNQIRGLSPWPVAHTIWKGERFKIHAAHPVEGSGPAGQIITKTKKELVVACQTGALSLDIVQPFGRGKLAIADFLNGAGKDIMIGETFGR